MTAIALLVEPGSTPSSVTITLDLFRIAHRFAPDDPFEVALFSSRGGAITLSDHVQLKTQPLPRDLLGFDAVILPGFFAEDLTDLLAKLSKEWRPVIKCLRELPSGTRIAASCYGTFVLAESGLLDGHSATTTWWLSKDFEARYPGVVLKADQALMDSGRVITAGAMTAHIDLSIYLLRRLKGDVLARQVGAVMLIDEARSSQLPFMALQRRFSDPIVDTAIAWMESHISEAFMATELADTLHISYRTLHRRFQAIAGMPPLRYHQTLRIEVAKELLETSRKSLEQIAHETGYSDATSFRRLFTRLTSLSPAQYRNRFSRSDSRVEAG